MPTQGDPSINRCTQKKKNRPIRATILLLLCCILPREDEKFCNLQILQNADFFWIFQQLKQRFPSIAMVCACPTDTLTPR